MSYIDDGSSYTRGIGAVAALDPGVSTTSSGGASSLLSKYSVSAKSLTSTATPTIAPKTTTTTTAVVAPTTTALPPPKPTTALPPKLRRRVALPAALSTTRRIYGIKAFEEPRRIPAGATVVSTGEGPLVIEPKATTPPAVIGQNVPYPTTKTVSQPRPMGPTQQIGNPARTPTSASTSAQAVMMKVPSPTDDVSFSVSPSSFSLKTGEEPKKEGPNYLLIGGLVLGGLLLLKVVK